MLLVGTSVTLYPNSIVLPNFNIVIDEKTMGFLFYAYVLTIGILGAIGAEWNTKDYMKKEHSLVRPYQGK